MFDRTHCWCDASSVSVRGSPAAASVRSTPNFAIDNPTSAIAASSLDSSARAACSNPNTGFAAVGFAGPPFAGVDPTCFMTEQYSRSLF